MARNDRLLEGITRKEAAHFEQFSIKEKDNCKTRRLFPILTIILLSFRAKPTSAAESCSDPACQTVSRRGPDYEGALCAANLSITLNVINLPPDLCCTAFGVRG